MKNRPKLFDVEINGFKHRAVVFTSDKEVAKLRKKKCTETFLRNVLNALTEFKLNEDSATADDIQDYLHDLIIWRFVCNEKVI